MTFKFVSSPLSESIFFFVIFNAKQQINYAHWRSISLILVIILRLNIAPADKHLRVIKGQAHVVHSLGSHTFACAVHKTTSVPTDRVDVRDFCIILVMDFKSESYGASFTAHLRSLLPLLLFIILLKQLSRTRICQLFTLNWPIEVKGQDKEFMTLLKDRNGKWFFFLNWSLNHWDGKFWNRYLKYLWYM